MKPRYSGPLNTSHLVTIAKLSGTKSNPVTFVPRVAGIARFHCIYVCVYVCIYSFMCVCIIYICMYVCMYVCIHVFIHSCMYVFIHSCMYLYACIYVRIYLCIIYGRVKRATLFSHVYGSLRYIYIYVYVCQFLVLMRIYVFCDRNSSAKKWKNF